VCLSLYLVGIVGKEDGSEREHCTGFWLIQDLVLCSLRVVLLGGEPHLCGMPQGALVSTCMAALGCTGFEMLVNMAYIRI
jgi:hypothetical protein